MQPLTTAPALVCFLLALSASASPAPPSCPQQNRHRLLLESPQSLLACAESTESGARLYAAQARLATGDHQGAASLLAALQPVTPLLQEVLALTRAKALLGAGEAGQALELLPTVLEPSWLQAEVKATAARAALAHSQPLRADALAAEALSLGHPEKASLIALRLEAALKRKQEAQAAKWRRLLRVEHPESAQARALEASEPSPLSTEDLAARWRRWRWRGGASAVASECLEANPRLKGPAAASARFECGEALSTLRHAQAEKLLREAARAPSLAPKALLSVARVRGRTDDAAQVRKVCEELAKLKKASREQAECDYLAAFLQLSSGPREKGRQALDEVARRHASHSRGGDALWLLAMDDLRHSPADAFTRFDAMVKTARSAETAVSALYWRGRVRAGTEPEKAQADWREVLARDPYGYYALLASSRLGEGSAPGVCSPKLEGPSVAAPSQSALAKALLEGGFHGYAALELAHRVRPAHPDALSWSGFLAASGEYRLLLDVGMGRSSGARWPLQPERRAAMEASYPIAFPTALEKVPASVDRCFLLSLMRRESRYDPNAASAAEAHGLLQLLPSTARQLAEELGLPAPAPSELFDPALNVQLAAHYVARLSERFGHPFLAAAAYNGGPSAVARWLQEFEGLEIDEFVERIPYRETRHYVKAVGAAWNAYGLVWSGVRPPLSLPRVGPDSGGIDY